MTFKHGTITTTILPGGDVRLANTHDTLMIERADLDDAIQGLCAVRQLLDPVGYMAFVDKLIPAHTIVAHDPLTYADILRSIARSRGVLDDEDIEDITGKPIATTVTTVTVGTPIRRRSNEISEDAPLAEQLATREIAALAKANEELHRDESHPDFEYETTQTGRKSGVTLMPDGEGWEPNLRVPNHEYRDGKIVAEHWRNWERFEFHENEYWKRRKS